jgi:hypothetical protein
MENTYRLKVNDKVIWCGSWGRDLPKEVTVNAIEVCPLGEKHGNDVNSVAWSVINGDNKTIIVDLDNGHWAYDYQLKPI